MLMCMPGVTLADLPGRPCPIAAALDVVGERWALLIVRELALGNSRFEDIVRGTGAPRDRVAARLKALDDAGVIKRIRYRAARCCRCWMRCWPGASTMRSVPATRTATATTGQKPRSEQEGHHDRRQQ